METGLRQSWAWPQRGGYISHSKGSSTGLHQGPRANGFLKVLRKKNNKQTPRAEAAAREGQGRHEVVGRTASQGVGQSTDSP